MYGGPNTGCVRRCSPVTPVTVNSGLTNITLQITHTLMPRAERGEEGERERERERGREGGRKGGREGGRERERERERERDIEGERGGGGGGGDGDGHTPIEKGIDEVARKC